MAADWQPETASRWLAEAVETGNPLATLPDGIAPSALDEAEAVAFAVLEQLGLAPCGVRLLLRGDAPALAGPMIEGRLLPQGATVAMRALRYPLVTAAVVGVLAAALEEGGTAPPRFAALHPALDVSATRFGTETADRSALTADLARLGLVVAGRRKVAEPGMLSVSVGAKGERRRGVACDLAAGFAEAARVARRFGGLPAGALLVVAGLTPPVVGQGAISASLGALGRAEAICV